MKWTSKLILGVLTASGDDVSYLYAAQGRRSARGGHSAVSGHRWSMVDLRFTLRETEIVVLSSHP